MNNTNFSILKKSFILSILGNILVACNAGNTNNYNNPSPSSNTYSNSTLSSTNIVKTSPESQCNVIHNFESNNIFYPSSLIQGNDGSLYGTTKRGGNYNDGSIFRLDENESVSYSTLYSFTTLSLPSNLIQGDDSNFYGINSLAEIFQITPTGSETIFNNISNVGNLIKGNDGAFYGTTINFKQNDGTLFKMSLDGTESILYTFNTINDVPNTLIQGNDNNLYGITTYGGPYKIGTVLKITPDGTESIIYSFTDSNDLSAFPTQLVQGDDGYLYGSSIQGAIFRLTPTGNKKQTLWSTPGTSIPDLIKGKDGNLYGIMEYYAGYQIYKSSVFEITTNAPITETPLCDITSSMPHSINLLQGKDYNLYGITPYGGTYNTGSIFEFKFSN